ncbi:MAG: rhodanese-like domain-containing protein [Bacteroidota bacterium]|nr:rhodanese-like domain-containing protein [Candidatus Kapabacteria bacterium]MCS7302828.1 rhodanese-like domain-containing protein [Candidatus Kapabacteria bacterium]MCX7936958.1 rhodanese-like domain-containing protein [Chlorobiota bacterium]MDW8075599.1 rhodanese-like domain-containing protein [Bacteroidota bacterium]MDW8272102.1 rhodanese-like domain-containing protein [Bacteroidota bacterium]
MFRWLFGGSGIISPTEAKQLIARGAMLIDVRTPGEYAAGHVRGSRNIPLDQIERHIPELKKANKPVVLVCASGNRSGRATALLQNAGIEAYNAGSWVNLR